VTREVSAKIPIYDEGGELLNIRSYNPNPRADRRKIWSVRGYGSPPQLYPLRTLSRLQPGDSVLFCEGEWDALLALQSGITAVTRTAAARSHWQPDWTGYFVGLDVFICLDADVPGRKGAKIIGRGVNEVARSVREVRLPYRIRPKKGKDVSDLILEHGPDALRRAIKNSRRVNI
jgi:DNA primase